MCGIYGILSFGARDASPTAIERMARASVHRGPDDQGVVKDGALCMGMRRISIIDVEGGHQPIDNEDGMISAICNGEIYNFRDLRKTLREKGHRFRTGSDSEVIVHLYEEHGEDFVRYLDGMFGFALWDARRKELLLGRDRMGIKPLYVRREPNRLVFASELKAILAATETCPQIDSAALPQYLSLGYVPAPLSIFAGIEKLQPGSLLRAKLSDGSVKVSRYWRLADHISHKPDDWVEAVRTQIEESVKAQMVSDVPLGAFLSGGIDSSAVVAMMVRHSDRPVRTYAVGFDAEGAGAYYNELDHAGRVAQLFGTDHKEIIARPDAASLLPALLWHLDEPVADSAFITTYLVAQLASEDVKVILSGLGGDELFGGYRRYLGSYYNRWMQLVPRGVLRNVLVPLARHLPSDRHSPMLNSMRLVKSFILSQGLDELERYRQYVGMFAEADLSSLLVTLVPKTGRDALAEAFATVTASDAVEKLMEVDLLTQLPDDLLAITDRMTMATSIECRVPLIDQKLVDLALSAPPSLKVRGHDLKHLLKMALRGVLPQETLHRSKRGFGAPMGAWLKESLRGLVDSFLSRRVLERRGLFHWQAVEALVEAHRRNREDRSDHLQALVNLEIFSRIYVDGRSIDDVTEELKEVCA